jgi:hypothetical protein
VIWEDSAAPCDTWIAEEELPDTAIIVTRGWLVKDTKRSLKLAASCAYWEDTGKWIFGEQVTIPRKALIGEPRCPAFAPPSRFVHGPQETVNNC